MPVEVANPIRCDIDTIHCSYDSEAATRFFHTLRIADTLLKRFSTNFYGKISPVHFFRGSFDLAVTRFNGKRAPARPGVDSVRAEAYSHEVISAGFWPGNGGYGQAAFYAYAALTPDGLQNTVLKGKGGFNSRMGEFILGYVGHIEKDGVELFQAACGQDLEGIVAKLASGRYDPDATTWVKIKNRSYNQAEGRADFFHSHTG